MKSIIFYILIIIPLSIQSQFTSFKFSAKNDGYKGKIKSVKKYVKWIEKDETYLLDSILRFDGELEYEATYNEKGFISFSRGYSEIVRANRLVSYHYDDLDRIKLKTMADVFENLQNTVSFDYDKIENAVVEFDSLGSYFSIGGKNRIFRKKIHHLDSLGRVVNIEYIDESDASIKNTRNTYNHNSKIAKYDFYEFGLFTARTEIFFDTKNRKKKSRFYNSDYALIQESIFEYQDNYKRKYSRRDKKGNLEYESEEFYFYDNENNKVKELSINKFTGRRLEVEWQFEYY